jgi:TetR/AcrR family transcriptional regulator
LNISWIEPEEKTSMEYRRLGNRRVKNPETARRILAAAENIFAERGLAGARTDAIADAAHANKALLYYYFGSKEKLHRAVVEHLLRQVQETVQASAATSIGSPRERLLAFAAAYFDFLAVHPNYPRLIQRTWMHSGGLLDWIVKTYFRPFLARLCGLIEDGIAAGEFRRVDAMQTAFTIVSLTGSYFATAPLMSRVFRHDVLRPAALGKRRQAMLDFIEHGLFRVEARSR